LWAARTTVLAGFTLDPTSKPVSPAVVEGFTPLRTREFRTAALTPVGTHVTAGFRAATAGATVHDTRGLRDVVAAGVHREVLLPLAEVPAPVPPPATDTSA